MVAPALIATLGLLLVLLLFRPPGWVLLLFLVALFLPGRWWHWKTRRFRRGLRQLKRGDAGEARSEFEAFLFQAAREPNFRRVQPYFNLGRSYPYVAAGRANLGVCDLLQGKSEAALERFRAALAEDPSWVPAHYGEAVALKLTGQVESAEQSARQALELRPSYMAARLLLGSLLRESGREAEAEEVLAPIVEEGRDPEALLQALDDHWASERCSGAVMSRSNRSSRRWTRFFPVFGACALLAAVSLPARAGPVDTPAAAATDTVPRHARSSLSLYRDHPSVADVRRVLLRWDQQGGPGSISDSISIATMWRRARQYRSALEVLPADMSPDGTARPRVTFERARILLQAPPSGPGIPGTYEERRAEGGHAFWTACEGMDELTKRALWEDLRGLSTPDEQLEWESLDAGPEACDRVRRFVDERAFRMAVSPEERLQIHYARLHEVRGLYYLRTPRLTRDLADRIGRADSLEVDDRGLIQLRMGVPLVTVEPFMDLNETWAYFRPEGPRVFHFAPISKTGLHALADFRLLENLAHASGFTMPSELMGVGGGSLAYLYQSRRVLDYLYEDYHFRQMDSRMRAAGDRFNPGFQGFLAWEKEINEADARYAVSGIPDAPELAAGIEFAYETLRFREPGSDRSEVWFLASTRVGDLTARAAVDPVTGADGLVGYDLGARLAFLEPGGMRTLNALSQPVLEDPLASDDGIPVRFQVTLEPETYPYTLVLRDHGSERGKLGNWILDTVTVSARQFGIPSISDIAVAADSGGSWSRDGVSFLRVGPTHVVSSDGTAHTYFEVYGLRPGATYDVDVRVVPEVAADMAFDLAPDNLVFRLRFPSIAVVDREGLGIGRHYLQVELGSSSPGAYLLAVRVNDRSTGIESLPAVTPLYRPQARDAHWIDAPRRRSTIVNP